MSPILGIYASQITGHLYASSYESIATATVDSGAANTVTFSSIPQTYTHLQIRGIGKNTYTAGLAGMWFTLNGVGGTSYSYHYLSGSGTAASAGATTSTSQGYAGSIPCSNASTQANMFGGFVIDILDYTNTNKYKTIRSIGSTDTNGAGEVDFTSSLFMNTNAITSITFNTGFTYNFAQYSQFALYGIKG